MLLSLASFTSGCFVVLVYLCNSFIARLPQLRVLLFLIANIVFYLVLDRHHAPFLIALSSLTFVFGILIPRAKDHKRRILTTAHIAIVAGLLVYYKALQNSDSRFLIPLGISYLTFQSIGYIFDVSRGAVPAITDYFAYIASFAFFPAVSSGPILSSVKICRQIREPSEITVRTARIALLRIALGYFKKTVGDILGAQTTPYFAAPAGATSISAWIAVLALSAEVYADFSGYTDLAVGFAMLLGIRIPENFDLPFLARSVADHWRRWHMSLMEWFKNYFFLPVTLILRKKMFANPSREQIQIAAGITVFLTFILVGLWHGLTWNNLIWGLINGLMTWASPQILAFTERWFGRYAIWADVAFTFSITCLIRILTITRGLNPVVTVWASLFAFSGRVNTESSTRLLLVLLALTVPHAFDFVVLRKSETAVRPAVWWPLMLFLLLFAFTIGVPAVPFVYTQF